MTVSPLESVTTTAWQGNTLEGIPHVSFSPLIALHGVILNVLWLSDAAHIYEIMWSQLHMFKVQSPERPWLSGTLWRKWSFTYFSWILAGGDIIQHFCLNIIINVKNTETSPRLALQTLLHFWWVMRGRSVSLKRRTDIKQLCVRFLTPVTPSQLCAANRGLAGWRAGWHGTTMSPLHANPALVRHHATHSSHATCFLKEAKCE